MDDSEGIRRGYRKHINHGYGRIIPTSKGIAYDAMKYLEAIVATADSEQRDFLPSERKQVADYLNNAVRELRRRSHQTKVTSYATLPTL